MNIQVTSLCHTFSQTNRDPLLALKDIHIEIQSGEFSVLIGPSGCGKSTLLRILAGLLHPTYGEVLLGGIPPEKARSEKHIAWMAQKPALLPWRTVIANVALAQKINPKNSRELLSPQELLDLVRLGDFASYHPFALSGGMQQRAALARALASGANIWLMDEPFTALDELTRESLTWEVLRLWQRFRPTVLWVTHSIHEAVRLADRVLVMSPRPGQIHAQHSIPLPRPRDDTDVSFQHIVRALREDLAVTL
ncbi:MAG: ATP-binding cassette domain-containing protein [Anaerolineales bacterium]|nr:ATP-binding cassette domain-containing protein [Anaerolineales bacterium]